MNEFTVTSAQYQTNPITGATDEDIIAVIDGNTVTVPVDTTNHHYAAILEWVAEGNSIQDAS
jgi:hypothetical protein